MFQSIQSPSDPLHGPSPSLNYTAVLFTDNNGAVLPGLKGRKVNSGGRSLSVESYSVVVRRRHFGSVFSPIF